MYIIIYKVYAPFFPTGSGSCVSRTSPVKSTRTSRTQSGTVLLSSSFCQAVVRNGRSYRRFINLIATLILCKIFSKCQFSPLTKYLCKFKVFGKFDYIFGTIICIFGTIICIFGTVICFPLVIVSLIYLPPYFRQHYIKSVTDRHFFIVIIVKYGDEFHHLTTLIRNCWAPYSDSVIDTDDFFPKFR